MVEEVWLCPEITHLCCSQPARSPLLWRRPTTRRHVAVAAGAHPAHGAAAARMAAGAVEVAVVAADTATTAAAATAVEAAAVPIAVATVVAIAAVTVAAIADATVAIATADVKAANRSNRPAAAVAIHSKL